MGHRANMMRQAIAPILVIWAVAFPRTSSGREEPGERGGASSVGVRLATAGVHETGPGQGVSAEAKHEVLVEARPPPFSEGIFPCMECHKDQKDHQRRELGFHEEQQSVFDHDAEHRWCLDCHDFENRDVLRLASGAAVPFTESYRLCGQCHGDKYRDWRAGIHGKRVGSWDGPKTYLLCVSCHNPHSPAFKGVKEIVVDGKVTVAPTLEKLRPEPRPLRPEEMRTGKDPRRVGR